MTILARCQFRPDRHSPIFGASCGVEVSTRERGLALADREDSFGGRGEAGAGGQKADVDGEPAAQDLGRVVWRYTEQRVVAGSFPACQHQLPGWRGRSVRRCTRDAA